MATKEYRTTLGTMQWDSEAHDVEWADDPKPPDGDSSWVLVSTALGALRMSQQPIVWSWMMEVPRGE